MPTLKESIRVSVPVSECYHYWSNMQAFPNFMQILKEVQRTGRENVYHWKLESPSGQTVAWDVELDELEPIHSISWHTLDNPVMDMCSRVVFEEVEGGDCRVTWTMGYTPTGKAPEEFIVDVFPQSEIRTIMKTDLECFQRIMLKQPAAVKSQLGLSPSGSMQGSAQDEPYNANSLRAGQAPYMEFHEEDRSRQGQGQPPS